jgi:hypothetical protein
LSITILVKLTGSAQAVPIIITLIASATRQGHLFLPLFDMKTPPYRPMILVAIRQ